MGYDFSIIDYIFFITIIDTHMFRVIIKTARVEKNKRIIELEECIAQLLRFEAIGIELWVLFFWSFEFFIRILHTITRKIV